MNPSRFLRAIALPFACLVAVPIAVACGGIVQGGGESGGGGSGSGTTSSTIDDTPDDPANAIPVPATATATATPCSARRDVCSPGETSDTWAQNVIAACAPKAGGVCGYVDFLFEVDGSCVDHAPIDSFPPAFVACVLTRIKTQRCGPPRPPVASSGAAIQHDRLNVCP